jgi:hypothetical protein
MRTEILTPTNRTALTERTLNPAAVASTIHRAPSPANQAPFSIPAMGVQHVFDITESPKGQVATVRCTCGWETKCRAEGGASPRDIAWASGKGHVRGHQPAQTGAASEKPPEATPTAMGHDYALTHESDGSVVSRCSCRWATTFRSYPGGPPAAEVAREASDRHVAFHAAPAQVGATKGTGDTPSAATGLAGTVVAAAVVLCSVWVLASACSGSENDDPDGPSGKYSDRECAVLKYEATGDGSGADDAMVEYTIHCE